MLKKTLLVVGLVAIMTTGCGSVGDLPTREEAEWIQTRDGIFEKEFVENGKHYKITSEFHQTNE